MVHWYPVPVANLNYLDWLLSCMYMLRIQETLLAMNLVCVNYIVTVYQNLVFQALEQLICTKTWNWEAAHDGWVKITQEGFPLKWRIYIIGISEGVSIGSSSQMEGSGAQPQLLKRLWCLNVCLILTMEYFK